MGGFTLADDKYPIPVQKIEGADQPIALGEIVFLSLSKPDKTDPNLSKWVIEWKVMDGDKERSFRTMPDGSIFFGSGVTPRTITVYASVGYLFLNKDGDKLASADVRSKLLITRVQIGTGPTPPDPNPPTPDPVFPDGKFKLASTAYKLGMKVTPENRKAALELSKSFTSMASTIAAGAITKPEEILTKTTDANRAALDRAGVNKETWQQFFTDLQEVTYALYKDKKLVTADDYITAWRELSQGLEKVK